MGTNSSLTGNKFDYARVFALYNRDASIEEIKEKSAKLFAIINKYTYVARDGLKKVNEEGFDFKEYYGKKANDLYRELLKFYIDSYMEALSNDNNFLEVVLKDIGPLEVEMAIDSVKDAIKVYAIAFAKSSVDVISRIDNNPISKIDVNARLEDLRRDVSQDDNYISKVIRRFIEANIYYNRIHIPLKQNVLDEKFVEIKPGETKEITTLAGWKKTVTLPKEEEIKGVRKNGK